MSPAQLEHVGLWVRDLERMRDFYVQALDGEGGSLYENVRTGFRSYFVAFAGGMRIELMSQAREPGNAPGRPTGFAHVAFDMGSTTAVDAIVARLQTAGVVIADRARTTGDGYYEAVVLDPEGNRIELTGGRQPRARSEGSRRDEAMRELAAELRRELDRGAAALRGLTDAAAGASRGAGKWTRKEILGHLVDSASNNHQRFVRAQLSNPLQLPGYEQELWVSLQRYGDRDWTELVTLWVALNRHVAAAIEGVAPDKLETPCRIGSGEAKPLEWWMRDYLRHLRHHLQQLLE